MNVIPKKQKLKDSAPKAQALKDQVSKNWAREIFRALRKLYPEAHCELDFTNPLELLIATILSAQCTDKRVNEVTKTLFKRCKKLSDYLKLSQDELEEIIRSTGFFRGKAKNILGAATKISEEFGGKVPKTIEELTSLPGVGRKTANVVLGNAYSIPGLPVDTHVTRLANRLGLTKDTDAVKIEHQLCEMLPPRDWTMFSHLLIFHGRRICIARKPKCESCPLRKGCLYYLKGGQMENKSKDKR